jgi:phosphatidate phosphatase PAH1
VRFGKLKLLKSKQKRVSIEVNGVKIPEVEMIVDGAGEAFFIRQELVSQVVDFHEVMLEEHKNSDA